MTVKFYTDEESGLVYIRDESALSISFVTSDRVATSADALAYPEEFKEVSGGVPFDQVEVAPVDAVVPVVPVADPATPVAPA